MIVKFFPFFPHLGKDLSSRTETDLNCIFGRRTKPAKEEEQVRNYIDIFCLLVLRELALISGSGKSCWFSCCFDMVSSVGTWTT